MEPKNLPGRYAVDLEKPAGPVADPKESANYLTDLTEYGVVDRDIMTRGLEYGSNPAFGYSGQSNYASPPRLNIAQAEPIPTSQMPMLKAGNAVIFYQHKNGSHYIRIHSPGDRLNVIDRPVREDDKVRYSQEWQQFLERNASDEIDTLRAENTKLRAQIEALMGNHRLKLI